MPDNPSTATIPQRAELDPVFTWDLGALFSDDGSWERALVEFKARLDAIEPHRGTLSSSADALLTWLRLHDELSVRLGRIANYAYRRYDEDTRQPGCQSMMDRAVALETDFTAAVSWVLPELLDIPEAVLGEFLAEHPGLEPYRHHLADVTRHRPHARNAGEEEVLARALDLQRVPSNVFGMFNDADISFGSVTDAAGRTIEVTKGRYIMLQESTDRRLREDAFRALYGAYAPWKNTLASLLAGQVKAGVFTARSRRFASSRDASLFADNIPEQVYDTLISTVRAHLDPLHRSVRLRSRMLGLAAVKPWDLYVPLTAGTRREYTFDAARDMVLDGLRPLGDNYRTHLENAFSGRWIDVHESAGKASGAYSAWTYGAHPFILLNYNGTLKDVFTLAHELGHAMHSWHTWQAQPPVYGQYSIFCAEVASTCNEMLLMRHLLPRLADRDERLHLLMHFIDSIRGTLYNQVLFAEFEMLVHREAESGAALTADFMSSLMDRLYCEYYGASFESDPLFSLNWSRIPHFYRSFYVFQYATGLSAAIALSQGILEGREGALQRYLGFLSAGNSDYSMTLLKSAGVDLTTTQPVQAAAALLTELLDEVETLL